MSAKNLYPYGKPQYLELVIAHIIIDGTDGKPHEADIDTLATIARSVEYFETNWHEARTKAKQFLQLRNTTKAKP